METASKDEDEDVMANKDESTQQPRQTAIVNHKQRRASANEEKCKAQL